jgi:hypothetical protein
MNDLRINENSETAIKQYKEEMDNLIGNGLPIKWDLLNEQHLKSLSQACDFFQKNIISVQPTQIQEANTKLTEKINSEFCNYKELNKIEIELFNSVVDDYYYNEIISSKLKSFLAVEDVEKAHTAFYRKLKEFCFTGPELDKLKCEIQNRFKYEAKDMEDRLKGEKKLLEQIQIKQEAIHLAEKEHNQVRQDLNELSAKLLVTKAGIEALKKNKKILAEKDKKQRKV